MNPWLETAAILFLALAALGSVLWLSRQSKPVWVTAYCMALSVVIMFGMERYIVGLDCIPPFSWIASGRTRFAVAALIGPILILTPAFKLPSRRLRIMLCVLIGAFLIQYSILPFLLPALNQNTLRSLQTKIDQNGVCLQSTDYTCGPAAAVTALRRLGLSADEGQLACLCRTTSFAGTPPDVLAWALRNQYGALGLQATLKSFKSISELHREGLTIAVIKFDLLQDHYITVIEVNDQQVVVADPLSGMTRYSHEEFAKVWRFSGIVVKRSRPV